MRISDWSSDVCSSDLLAEEGGDAAEHVVGAEREQQRCDRPEPEQQQDAGDAQRPREVRPGMVGKALAKSGVAVVDYLSAGGTMSAAALECGVTSAAPEEADQIGREKV